MSIIAKKKAAVDFLSIKIPELKLKTFTLKIIGDTPLVTHRWSEKAKTEMFEKQQKKAKQAKDIRYPNIEFAKSLYWLTEEPNFDGLTDEQADKILAEIIPKSKFGFSSNGFKQATLDAGFQQGALTKAAGSNDLAKTTARGAFHILGDFAVIEGTPTPREDIVRIGGAAKTPDFRWRAEFKTWQTKLTIQYNSNAMSIEQIANLFQLTGFCNGVGEWRPSRNGKFGTFHIE